MQELSRRKRRESKLTASFKEASAVSATLRATIPEGGHASTSVTKAAPTR
jgi:hypothetical protein